MPVRLIPVRERLRPVLLLEVLLLRELVLLGLRLVLLLLAERRPRIPVSREARRCRPLTR